MAVKNHQSWPHTNVRSSGRLRLRRKYVVSEDFEFKSKKTFQKLTRPTALQIPERKAKSSRIKSEARDVQPNMSAAKIARSSSSQARTLFPQNISDDISCTTCSKVDFSALTVDRAFETAVYLMVSTVGSILANKSCASCRLIAHHLSSLPDARSIPSTASVKLQITGTSFVAREENPTSIVPVLRPYDIEIHLCSLRGPPGYLYPVQDDVIVHGKRGSRLNGPFTASSQAGVSQARQLPETADIRMLKAWMGFCSKSHKRCQDKQLGPSPSQQVRLIDVNEGRLVNATLQEKYLALSYVWGKSATAVLTASTLCRYQEEGSLNIKTLPRLVFDAMEFVKVLGERYLWVDTACIVQDDVHDKQRQLPIMDSIYSRASIIMIAVVNSSRESLPRWSNGLTDQRKTRSRTRVTQPPTEVLDGVSYTVGQPNLESALNASVWNSRGWTFQEGLLARRALIFTEHQVYWNCVEESWCEDRYAEFRNIRHLPTDRNSILASLYSEAETSLQLEHVYGINVFCGLGTYLQKVEQYTKREFRDYADVIWAVVGILKALKDRFPRGYIWGLPYDHLDEALLWDQCCISEQKVAHTILDEHATLCQLVVPSWTWLVKGHHIMYGGCPGSAIVSCVTWHDPIKDTTEYDMVLRDNTGLKPALQTSVFVGPAAPRLEPGLLDFGLLHFTAQVASLGLRRVSDSPDHKAHSNLLAQILLPSGKIAGPVLVPRCVICSSCTCNDTRMRDFVLLSIDTGKRCLTLSWEGNEEGTPKQRQQFPPTVNLMLIDWRETAQGKRFAVRLALVRVKLEDWDGVEMTEQDIVLG